MLQAVLPDGRFQAGKTVPAIAIQLLTSALTTRHSPLERCKPERRTLQTGR